MLNLNRFTKHLLSLTDKKAFLIAYSGGLDSHVLLHMLSTLRDKDPTISLRAIHVNHQLSLNADEWEEHCQRVCENLDIELIIKTVRISYLTQKSVEETARRARYHVIADSLLRDEMLATAHHQNDQAETVLLQLMRGCGVKGLSAMPAIKCFSTGYHIRPLLDVTHDELLDYAKSQNLKWIEDESNECLRFDRNFVRKIILPKLNECRKNVAASLARTATNCAQASQLLDELAMLDVEACNIPTTLNNKILQLPLPKLNTLDAARRRNVLRYFIAQHNVTLPSQKQLEQIECSVCDAASDAMPVVKWGEYEIHRYQDRLYLLKQLPNHDASQCFEWDLTAPLMINNLGVLNVATPQLYPHNPYTLTIHDRHAITVRFRQGGETIWLNHHHHALKKCFQTWHVPPWERSRIPLIFLNNELICVVDYFVDERFSGQKNSINITWERL